MTLFGFSRAQTIAFGILLILIVVSPLVLYPIFLMQVMCFSLFALGCNLLMGYIGLLSLGQAAYFGMGGYITAYAVQSLGVTPEIGIVLGGLTGAALGTVFGWLAIRRTGIYFAMITLALAQMVYFFAVEAPFTGG
ncbi:MAG TPA: branched-chain amino acid ABC transporter permease, partial [Acetobacteraceae bacterium]|nr:branched-chain amino acid ABC transporter permease [Acetobacteraceae bacterium]